MKTLKILNFILILLVTITCSYFVHAQNLDEIISIAEMGDNILVSGIGKITYERTIDTESDRHNQIIMDLKNISRTPENVNFFLNLKGEMEFAFKKNLYSVITRVIEEIFEEEKRVFNGEQVNILRKNANLKGLISLSGAIENYQGKRGYIIEIADPRHFYNIYGEPVAEFLRRDAQFIGEEEKNGVLCKVFKGKNYTSGDDIIVWLSPSDMYHRPIHIEYIDPATKTKHEYYNEYTKENNLLVLKKVVMNYYYLKESNNDWSLFSSTVFSFLEESQFNIDIPDTLFQMEFPKGIVVVDMRTGQVIQGDMFCSE